MNTWVEALEPGLDKAAEYISKVYSDLGLQPFPNQESFLVPYTLYQAGWEEEQKLSFQNGDVATDIEIEQWIPFPFSDSGTVNAEVVFAGYGITAPEHDWDDYKDIDVEGKIVLLLRREPNADDPESPFNGAESSEYGYFRTKADNAEDGAVGMILFTDPTHPNQSDDFRRRPQLYLEPPEFKNMQQGPQFLAAQTSPKSVEYLFENQSLLDVQQKIDGGTPASQIAIQKTTAELNWNRKEEATTVTVNNVVGYLEGNDPEL